LEAAGDLGIWELVDHPKLQGTSLLPWDLLEALSHIPAHVGKTGEFDDSCLIIIVERQHLESQALDRPLFRASASEVVGHQVGRNLEEPGLGLCGRSPAELPATSERAGEGLRREVRRHLRIAATAGEVSEHSLRVAGVKPREVQIRS